MPNLEPSYLRHVYNELSTGSIHPENGAALPIGFIGLYEQEFSQLLSVKGRNEIINQFTFFALFKRPVSTRIASLIIGIEEKRLTDFVNQYSSWFNSPESGKYQLYHERLRVYFLSKVSNSEIDSCHISVVNFLKSSTKVKDSRAYYFNHYIDHLVSLAYYNEAYRNYLNNIVFSNEFWNNSFLELNSIQPAIENIRNIITYSVYSGDWQMLNRCAELILFLGQKNDILCEELLAEEKIDKEAIELCFDSISSSFDRLRFVSIATLKIIESTTESDIDQEWLEQLWIQLVGYVQSEYVNGAYILPYWAKIKLE